MKIISVEEIHELAKSKGWWDGERNIPEVLCLIHSEVSEALEAYRRRDDENMREELADVVIRVWDLCGYLGVDIASEVEKKHEFNKGRSYRHGNKRC